MFSLELEAPAAGEAAGPQVLERRRVAVVSASAVVQEAARLQVEALGGAAALFDSDEALRPRPEAGLHRGGRFRGHFKRLGGRSRRAGHHR